ncbi:MAG: aminotransferase class IV [Phycisphaeraceae bacterium]|nr:aminotransferase class IV [Phycisphaeraceae bacterium]
MIVHLNGSLLPLAEARISPLDRGFVFGDGIYEGLRSVSLGAKAGDVHIIEMARHEERMAMGLREARIGFDPRTLRAATLDLLRANSMKDAFVYWQVTRGTPGEADVPRSRVPKGAMTPTVFGYCSSQPGLGSFRAGGPPTKSSVLLEDIRWSMGHVKSISLMGNVLLAMRGDAAGADEPLFSRSGLVTEGAATNVILAIRDSSGRSRLVTPSLTSAPILAGVTRAILLEHEPAIEQRPVRVDELERASEVMLVGTTTMVTSVVSIDGRPVGDRAPGPESRRLLTILLDAIEREVGAGQS